ncbi:MAG: hypothetical protein KDF63_09600 [Rhodoferax sp.]|jgi:hypothetical protein|nr:hypothetical protein [Rhodoferax sp.]MCP5289007.1 hypothetical protein [Burkholderiaceae bacterium]
MDSEAILLLLALGPVSAAGFYWAIYRHYRNTDKSHAYEHETAVEVLALTGAESDRKVDEVRATRSSRIQGDNVGNHRQRVKPM